MDDQKDDEVTLSHLNKSTTPNGTTNKVTR